MKSEAGKTIRDLVHDGELVRDDLQDSPPSPRRVSFDFSQIPLPLSTEARQLRQRLEIALNNDEQGKVAMLTSLAARLRPSERDAAAHALLKMVKEQG